MKILHLSHSDISGGAARASYRLHRALLSENIDSKIMVRTKKTDDWTVISPSSRIEKLTNLFRSSIGAEINKLQRSDNLNLRSGNWLYSTWAKKINSSDVDIVNIHWVGSETLSIKDIGRINKPIVWTMHDMWPFCGAEHYSEDQHNPRWLVKYTKNNRTKNEKNIDIDKIVWRRKLRAWKNQNMHIVSPSQWLANCAQQSALFQKYPINVIPNLLDTKIYQPLEKSFCRNILKLPHDKNIILFGAIGGGNDPRKGYQLLVDALMKLKHNIDTNSTICVIFGQSAPKNPPNLPFETKWLGHIHDDETLALVYNSASVMIVPSKQEAFGQTASEALSCGTPVVSFAIGGLLDIITHKETGYLAEPFNTTDLAHGIEWILKDNMLQNQLGYMARKKAIENWSIDVITNKYIQLYENILEK
ncbi:glycosyltransferase family 4 protein [Providencia rettgeri]|uniref:glycosyltransferase family 4 protein n=1 Tax=Providencia rettgeri TaxID=587 RepID=UPI001BA50D23|nr:glycosyltransferase family 4 protein [Providencia rettgeri]MBS0860886.1 glycosyltransferase family 4 protein [Providencia rettgeri]MBS0874965.1 glycosyltransferase family 4 protein [Providencia rettgeri]MBS0921895.1 glycosyltransferase family 4 protein [Providencia rettgeri]